MNHNLPTRRSPVSVIAGMILMLFGVALLLLTQFLRVELGFVLWPFLIIVIGAVFFAVALVEGERSAGLAVPGGVITMVGMILAFQNVTGLWASWSYAWGLIIVGAGIGTWLSGLLTHKVEACRSGVHTVKVGLILFLAFGAFFEGIIGVSGIGVLHTLWPVALILMGALLLLGDGRRAGPDAQGTRT